MTTAQKIFQEAIKQVVSDAAIQCHSWDKANDETSFTFDDGSRLVLDRDRSISCHAQHAVKRYDFILQEMKKQYARMEDDKNSFVQEACFEMIKGQP